MSAIDTLWEYLAVAVGILVVLGGIVLGLMRGRGGRTTTKDLPPSPPAGASGGPAIDVDAVPEGSIGTLERPDTTEVEPELPPAPAVPTIERPDAPAGRLRRLRARLARSNTALGKGLLALLAGGRLDAAAMVTDTVDLAGLPERFARLGRDTDGGKVIVRP